MRYDPTGGAHDHNVPRKTEQTTCHDELQIILEHKSAVKSGAYKSGNVRNPNSYDVEAANSKPYSAKCNGIESRYHLGAVALCTTTAMPKSSDQGFQDPNFGLCIHTNLN